MAPKRHVKHTHNEKKSKNSKENKKNADSKRNHKISKCDNKDGAGNTKMTLCTIPTIVQRTQLRERRTGRPSSGKRVSVMPGKVRSAFRRSLDPCDNSNDSGLGFEHHLDHNNHNQHNHHHHVPGMSDRLTWPTNESKKPRLDVKLENEDINDGYCFPENLRTGKSSNSTTLIRTAPSGSISSVSVNSNQSSSSGRAVPRCMPLTGRTSSSLPVSLTAQLSSISRRSDVSLTIIRQPEQQHRARYQTEGSRGAVKDRDGNGFPIVQLVGYYKPTTLQVFIGTDVGKVAPHMFYQACKVSGKNSTPCTEKKIEGTCVIELQLEPTKEMSATCDCVGILKERNVDVEHRFPEQLGNRSKKKSTRCRMIFRTTLAHDDGTIETLQVCSQPIVCTQPPGIPEICKKSLTSCPASGGLELFVLGKNFLKDTKVYFQLVDDDRQIRWELSVTPDKEYLQQTHFVCVVPPYRRPDITEPVTVRLCVVSSGKTSEPHQFVYTPVNGAVPSVHINPPSPTPPQSASTQPANHPSQSQPFFNKVLWMSKHEQEMGIMPPPETNLVPLSVRRSSLNLASTSDGSTSPLANLKQEYIDENSQNSIIDQMDIRSQDPYRQVSESSMDVHPGDSNISMLNENSVDLLRQHENSNLSVGDEIGARRDSIDNTPAVLQTTDSIVTDRLVLAHSSMINPDLLSTASAARKFDDLKVIDLRMKVPMDTVAELMNSTAPSMATLQTFGITNGPLPAQSAQSVENFLTNIESKTVTTVSKQPTINTEKLDALVNSTVESHIGSPPRPQPDLNVLLGQTPTNLMVPLPDLNQNTTNLTPDVILNAQISPSLMCRATQENLLTNPLCPNGTDTNLLPVPTQMALVSTEPEKAVLFEAAADLIETQKKISELEKNLTPTTTEILTGATTNTVVPPFVATTAECIINKDTKNDFVISVPVKDMPHMDNKNTADRMIPQSFAELTETELINLMNPSCFDQV